MKVNMSYSERLPRVDVVFDWRGQIAKGAETGFVSVRIYQDGKRRYINTNVRVRACEWNDEWGVVGRADAAKLNGMIQEQVDKCRKMIGGVLAEHLACEAAGGTTAKVINALPSTQRMKVDRSEASFLDWMRKQIDECGLADGTVRHHNTVYESLCEFGKIKRFEDVRSENLNEWLRWVGTRTVGKAVNGKVVDVRITPVTIYGYWKRVKKWIGVAQDLKLLPMDAMAGVRCERGRSKEREFLTDSELQLLQGAEIIAPYLVRVRDLFLIECGCGLAFRDMMEADLRKVEKMGDWWTLQGRRCKTGEQYFTVLMPWVHDILVKYDFRLPAISNQKYNKYLKELMGLLDIDKHVTSHVGRHTYACYCLRHGVRLEAVQRTLGHSSIKTTQIYAKLVDNDVVEAFGKMK